jgi:lysophospholipase L1-like esterase
MNKKLEEWCKTKGVSYHDVLPAFIGKDIRQFRISDTDIHFNDLGHQIVGVELKNFLDTLIVGDSENLLVAR